MDFFTFDYITCNIIKSLYLCVICINFKISTLLQIVVHKILNVQGFVSFWALYILMFYHSNVKVIIDTNHSLIGRVFLFNSVVRFNIPDILDQIKYYSESEFRHFCQVAKHYLIVTFSHSSTIPLCLTLDISFCGSVPVGVTWKWFYCHFTAICQCLETFLIVI